VKILLDTHAFLWYLMADSQLSAAARTLIADVRNQLFLSMTSLWEMAIKLSIGKLTLPAPFVPLIPQQLQQMKVAVLPVKLEHVAAVVALPFHHKDPFDRMLVARCQVAQLPLLSADAVFDQSPVQRLW
jgi:PIN domain nuclease of toxin-antitoxin system